MKYTKLFLYLVPTLLILSFVFCKKSLAVTYFSDNFESGNLNQWTHNVGNVGNTSSWYIQDNVLHSSVTKGKYSFLYANIPDIPSNYKFSANVKNISGVDQQYVFRVTDDKRQYYLVDYRYNDLGWSQDNNNIKLYRIYKTNYKLLGSYPSTVFPRKFNISQGVDHKVGVIINGNNIQVYFDDNKAIDSIDLDIFLDGKGIGLMTWGGDYNGVSENIYKVVKIEDLSHSYTKTILLPGLGASWNHQAILFNSTSPENQWSMTPFVKNYDLLIKGLENNGLEKGKDFYVWNYDWRKSLSQIVDDFNSYILSLNLGEGEKVNLVGHSLGGLISRIWSQDNASVVDKVITLGSPHYGSVKAYEAWNGVKISDNLDVASVALNVLLQLQKKNYDTGVQTLRNYAPIVYDLIPTFSFLKRNGVVVLGNSSEYLKSKNLSTSLISGKLSTLDAMGVPTKEWLSLGDRSLFDRVLGIWEDGRPISYSNGEGDGTVLKKSSLITGSEMVDFSSDHGAIVDKSTNWVLTKLGLGLTLSEENTYSQKQSVFYVYAPASVEVKCNDVVQEEKEGWIVANDLEVKDCNISLLGSSVGNYRIVAGDSNKWQYFEGDIQEDQKIVLGFSESNTNWQLLKQNLINIGAIQALAAANQGNIALTIDEYIKYRMSSKNFKNSEEILENSRYLMNLNSYTQSQVNSMYSKALSAKSLVETNLRLMARGGKIPSYSSSLNNEQALGMMSFGKNYAANYIAYKLYGIVWK
ncbi:MAG TPA: alpha/beta fold hydrolase [Candidatus Methanoperedens sp.]|nr:alpha/beta fold hydrolase [Candidatus Methanoperedens sp.]